MSMICIKKDVLESWLKNKLTSPRTFEEIADHIGVSQSLLSMVLSYKRQVTPNIQRKLCDLTGYDVGDLFHHDRDKNPEECNT